ncbi:Mu transposase C-terminal domain-containing protein [Acinetobacter baumannii]|uniref:Mu transposase C-terminal domain-containing protein n=1 Tax=Acinetobacter baumannii TaxID=470 RepID=UPI00385DAD6B
MEKPLLIPQSGLRFTIANHEHVFEITSSNYGVIRYAAIAGGKPCSIPTSTFETRYKNGEIQCVFAPEKLFINPDSCSTIRRKERYVLTALAKLTAPTSIEPLRELIQEIAAEIKDPSPPSARTVARWIFQYRLSSNSALSLSEQGKGNRTLRYPPEVYQIINQGISEVYLQPEHRTSKDVRAFVLGKFIEQNISLKYLPSRRAIQRAIARLDPYIEMRVKKGSRIARKYFQAAGISTPSPFALYTVEIDTHYLDIIVIDPETGQTLGRPFLACAIDTYSRAIVGTYISMFPPSALTTLALIKDMITRPNLDLPGGIPSIIIPDNGVEFKNNSLARVCEQLKITITPSQIGTPNNKPHIERFFGTLTEGILQKLLGTTFSNPTARGEYDSSGKASLTLDKVKEYVDSWINMVYQQTIHGTTDRAPILAWNDATEQFKPSSLTKTDADIICRRPVNRNINHGQVIIDGLSYFSHALTTLKADGIKKVTVLVDDLDLSKVYIIHPDKKDLVIQADSTQPEYTYNLSHSVHLEVQKRKKQMSESDRQRLGKYADLYNLYLLMKDIQNDLIRKKPKLKQLKIELPRQLTQLESELTSHPSNEELTTIHPQQNAQQPAVSFGSLKVKRNDK